MRLRRYKCEIAVVFVTISVVEYWLLFVHLPTCQVKLSPEFSFNKKNGITKLSELNNWRIPDWVQRYNVSYLFDWTWYKNGDLKWCRQRTLQLDELSACKVSLSIAVNDPLEYFSTHPDEGCIVDITDRLPNVRPHPLPRSRSLFDTCSTLNINQTWALCSSPQSQLDELLPGTTKFVTIAVFNAFVDTGSCHSEVPGTVFTPYATYHFQEWTGKSCANKPIRKMPRIMPKYRHYELIDSIGAYLEAPGHFGPQQLPRLLRLLATVPSTAKILVAKGSVPEGLIDVLIENGVLTRDRIVFFDKGTYHIHFANIVYRSEPWPYLKGKEKAVCFHDRTDMQLVRQVLTGHLRVSPHDRNRVVIIKRENGRSRSIVEHSDLVFLIISMVNKSRISSSLQVEIFDARGHIRDHIALFNKARVIIGPHGAGMMNVLWALPGTHVVEVGYNSGMIFPQMYAEMSLHLDHHYWICKGRGDYSTPIHVDFEDFGYIFNEILRELEMENSTS